MGYSDNTRIEWTVRKYRKQFNNDDQDIYEDLERLIDAYEVAL